VAQIAQGRVWSGLAAKEIGLVDEIGGLDAAIQYAASRRSWERIGNCKSILVRTFEQRLLGQRLEVRSVLSSITPLDNYHLIR